MEGTKCAPGSRLSDLLRCQREVTCMGAGTLGDGLWSRSWTGMQRSAWDCSGVGLKRDGNRASRARCKGQSRCARLNNQQYPCSSCKGQPVLKKQKSACSS